jgi:hypothetical protein
MIAYDIDITPSPSAGTHVLGYLFNALSISIVTNTDNAMVIG